MISEDNIVRLIDAIVNKIYFTISKALQYLLNLPLQQPAACQ